MSTSAPLPPPSREHLLHTLYEAAELEHNLMCTYLYAAFSLKRGTEEGLTEEQARVVDGWRRVILDVALEEMGHLAAVWNISVAIGGAPRFGRENFPLDPGILPAGIVVKLAPFNEQTLQHFVHLERPTCSDEPEGKGFEPEIQFTRGNPVTRLFPMGVNYETVGDFYGTLSEQLQAFVEHHGEEAAFSGNRELQLTEQQVPLKGVHRIICAKTALLAFRAIVEQGEGAPEHSEDSHFSRFSRVREEFQKLREQDPEFRPSFPTATNPVLRRPFKQERVWIENEEASITVDLANTVYATMLRLLAYSYSLPDREEEKQSVVELSLGLMRAFSPLAEHAARLPAGLSQPECNAGVTFTALRDAAGFMPSEGARRFFVERFEEMSQAAESLASSGAERPAQAARILAHLFNQAKRKLTPEGRSAGTPKKMTSEGRSAGSQNEATSQDPAPPVPEKRDGVEYVPGKDLTLLFEAQRCIHARFCVTGAPAVFLANVQGPWIRPDAIPRERLLEIAHACPSGAIRYERKDGGENEQPPPVNLLSIREAGPYAVRGDIDLEGQTGQFRMTLCRCGASKNKPYCDGSHHEVQFAASGEPPTGDSEPLQARDGTLRVEPQLDGPLQIRGNLEVTSGTGRVVARVTSARLCRCGGSQNKPFCDGTHSQIGFRST